LEVAASLNASNVTFNDVHGTQHNFNDHRVYNNAHNTVVRTQAPRTTDWVVIIFLAVGIYGILGYM
jgi:hypothetical protein